MLPLRTAVAGRRPHVIVLGNEKGGSGKSTTAMHLIVALLRSGATVGSLDLDARQGTLSRYVENRRASARNWACQCPITLPCRPAGLIRQSWRGQRTARTSR
jgi:chromosome partitioning protein